jgi:hypothetical protein
MLAFPDFPKPVQLMLLAARTRLSETETSQIAQLCTPALDWDQFLAVTLHHRLSPLVFEGLERARPAALPAFVRQELHRRSTVNAFLALRLTHEVCRLTAALEKSGFALSVLKGVPLSQLLYGNPNIRHVGDIDLLTHPVRLFEQVEILAKAGYTRINPPCKLTPHRLESYTSYWKDFTFASSGGEYELDLHWRLFNNRFHAANRILERGSYITVSTFGCEMRVFSPIDQFIYIAAHGISDAWTYLKSLADIAAFLNILTPAELDQALLRATELGLLSQISAAIHLANEWMGTHAEHPRLAPASDPISLEIRERTTGMLLRHNFQPHRSHPSPAEWLQLELKLVPGYRSLFEIAQRFVWRPRVWTSFDLPDRWFWLYPLLGLVLPPRPHSSHGHGASPAA